MANEIDEDEDDDDEDEDEDDEDEGVRSSTTRLDMLCDIRYFKIKN